MIVEAAIRSFSTFFERVEDEELRGMIVSFVSRHAHSPREALARAAREFLAKHVC